MVDRQRVVLPRWLSRVRADRYQPAVFAFAQRRATPLLCEAERRNEKFCSATLCAAAISVLVVTNGAIGVAATRTTCKFAGGDWGSGYIWLIERFGLMPGGPASCSTLLCRTRLSSSSLPYRSLARSMSCFDNHRTSPHGFGERRSVRWPVSLPRYGMELGGGSTHMPGMRHFTSKATWPSSRFP